MAYTPYMWVTGDPITQEKMRHIEEGIASTTNTADTSLNYAVEAKNLAQQVNNDLTSATSLATEAMTKALQAMTATEAGANAWSQIEPLMEFDPDTHGILVSLKGYLENMREALENSINATDSIARDAASKASLTNTEVVTARDTFTTLDERLDSIDSTVSIIQSAATSINEVYNQAKGNYNSLALRLTAIDGNPELATVVTGGRVGALEAEINAARDTYANLNLRLNAIESSAGTLDSNAVKYVDIKNNLTSVDTDKPLSAAMGKELKDTIGGSYNSSNTVAVGITSAANAAETNAKNYTNSLLGTGFTTTDTVADALDDLETSLTTRIDAIDNAETGTIHGLDERVSALETEIDMTSSDSRIDLVENEVTTARTSTIASNTYDSLDARLEAIETAAVSTNNNINIIAEELSMINNDTITNNGTRIDSLETNLQTINTTTNARIDSLEDTITDTETGLAATKAIADAAATASDLSNLTDRVLILENEPKSATVVITKDCVTYDSNTGLPTIYTSSSKTTVITPTEDADYLLQDEEDKYYYWKYIGTAPNGIWELISGGGNGSSSGLILSTLPSVSEGDANVDYFIGNNTVGYIHYRFVEPTVGELEGHYIRILPNNLINDLSVNQYGGLVAHTINDDQTNLLSDFYALKDVTYTPNYDPQDSTKLVSQTLQFTRTDGQTVDPIVIIGGGGEGGSVYTVNIETTTPISRSIPANSTDPITITAKVVMKQGNELLGSGATATGQIQYRRYGASTWNMGDQIEVVADNPALKYTINNNTFFTIDVSKYLETDQTTQIRLAIVASPAGEGTEVERYLTFSISKVNISIVAEAFDYASVKNSNFQFNYRCFGSGINKTVYFIMDGATITTVNVGTSHNTVLQQIIPMTGKENGMHTFEVYFVTSTGLQSNRLNYFVLYNTDNTRVAPLLGAAAEKTSIVDGDELVVNYSVSTLGSETTDLVEIELYTLEANDEKRVISTTTLTNVGKGLADPPYHTFDYPKVIKTDPNVEPDPINVYVKLTATHNGASDSKTVMVQVRYLDTKYNLEIEGKNNLLYEYVAYGHSNNDAIKNTYTYSYTTVGGQTINFTGTFNNFNWATDGYVDGESLIIGGGATHTIDVPIFNGVFNGANIEENANVQDITQNGRTIEIDYEVLSTTDLNATIIDCMSAQNIGFRITPQNCYLLNSSSNIDIDDTGFIKNEENVAAAYLSPGVRTHLTFVIEPWAAELAADGSYHQSTNIYINGEFANACPYNRNSTTGNLDGNNFSTNATISIGSDTCLIKIYSIRLYNRGLTAAQVLHNYEVAPVATRNKLNRLEDNDILNDLGQVDYEKARKKYTCLLLTGMGTVNGNSVPTMAPYKGYPSVVGRQKDGEVVGKTESGLLLTKPSTENPEGYTIEFNLQDKLVDGVNLYGYASSNNVQGTSSQKFPVKNLKVYLAKGKAGTEVYDSDDPETRQVIAYTKSDKVKYSLRGDAGIGESTLCWKADYMSTDHANTFNANIADTLYSAEDRLSERWTVKSQFTVYGIKCLLFQQNGADASPEFVGDGCLNNDKGNHKTFALETDIEGVWQDENNNTMCQKWDFRNNTDSLLFFKHDGLFEQIDGKPAASRCLESIYPDEGDLADAQSAYKAENNGATDPTLDVNYNHFQILASWLGNRANYWYETDSTIRANKKQIFINEFRNHFNFNHILIYYLFMEYTALCDNRVKNIHMRTDNAGEEKIRINGTNDYYFEGNNNPNSGPWTIASNLEIRTRNEPILDENGDYQFDNNGNMILGNVSHTFVKDAVLNTIDWQQGEDHSNFAIWAPVLYDLDSCFSAENVGYLKVRYDADWNYNLYNKMIFAGFDSILWLQVEDCFQDELKTMAKRLYDRVIGLNYSTFYQQQITDNLASLCPAITNQDMILKYERPWTEGFLDYSQNVLNPTTSTDNYKYLQRGTRTLQKAIFMKQRSLLLSSKYDANEFKQDKITFRAGTEVNRENAVLTLTANQKLYHGVQFGDQNDVSKVTRRAATIYNSSTDTWDTTTDGLVPAFVPCRVPNIGNMGNSDGLEIYGASVLNDIGDLSKFHPYQLRLQNAINLKKLILGSEAAGYSNTRTSDIQGLDSCALLEEINVCNCKGLTSLQLSNNGFIKKVYATGSGLKTLSLPHGGVLNTVAYGENTTDITIINQGRLTNFSYENSDTNNYENVTRLWIENTPNVPVKEIITNRIIGLQAGGLRIVGLELNLGNDSSFLELLASDLAKGTYLSSAGSHVEGNDQYPYISGTITIYDIRQSLLTKLNNIYPNLTINVTHETINEFTIVYKNYDGTVLYTDHRIGTEHYIDPVADTNPVTQMKYIGVPEKPQDVQYEYLFGTYTNNTYNRFSGWVKENTTTNPTAAELVGGDTILIAYYPTTVTRQYTVTWYDEPNGTQLLSYTRDYGVPIGTLSAPEDSSEFIRAVRTGTGYKVFKGWSRPVGKLTGNMNVYAQWENSSINDNVTASDLVMSELNAADIYALSQITAQSKVRALESKLGNEPIYVQMGHDFNYIDGVTTYNLLGNADKLLFDGSTIAAQVFDGTGNKADIKPLAINQDWTLAIDYKFLLNAAPTAQELVLASCYKNANASIQGFKLSLVRNTGESTTGDYKNHNICVTWGTESVTIDYAAANVNSNNNKQYGRTYRNIVVLRHDSANPTKLYVYYALPDTSSMYSYNTYGYGAEYGMTVRNSTLTWENANTLNTPLILGGNYEGSTTSIENSEVGRKPANGIIYWAKYWDVDLGIKNCSMLASWTHEKIPFYLSGYNNNDSPTKQILANTSLSFVAAQGIGDRYICNARALLDNDGNDVSEGTWKYARARRLLNNRIYNGLSIAYQSIIKQTSVPAYGYLSNGNTDYTNPNCLDYLYLPAEREVNPNASAANANGSEVQQSWSSPWPWMYAENVNNVYRLNDLDQLVKQTSNNTIAPFLIRFSNNYISANARIYNFADNNDPDATVTGWSYNNQFVFVQSGDAWIRSDGIYIYYTNEEIANNGIYVDRVTSKGGWKKAMDWTLRSYDTGSQPIYNDLRFRYIDYAGTLVSAPVNSSRYEGRLLCPEFSI